MGRIWIIIFVGILAAVASIHCADPPESNNSQLIVSHIPRQPIDSTAIAKSVYRDLMSAESRTQFYDFNIKGKYSSVRVRPRIKDKSTN